MQIKGLNEFVMTGLRLQRSKVLAMQKADLPNEESHTSQGHDVLDGVRQKKYQLLEFFPK